MLPNSDRNALGRFIQGNRISCLGWAGLVNKRFHGEAQPAKSWLIRLGLFAYAKQTMAPGWAAQRRRKTCFAHPGTPEEFLAGEAERVKAMAGILPEVDFYRGTGQTLPPDLAEAILAVEQGETYATPYVQPDTLSDQPGYAEGTQPWLY